MDEYRDRYARAYRDGELVCGRVELAIGHHQARLGLARGERRCVVARFLEDLDYDLREELWQLIRRRGRAAKRIAEGLEPVELAYKDWHGREHWIAGRLEPPFVRSGGLREIEFGVREATHGRGTAWARPASTSP